MRRYFLRFPLYFVFFLGVGIFLDVFVSVMVFDMEDGCGFVLWNWNWEVRKGGR